MNYVLDFRGASVGGPVVPGRLLQINGIQLGTELDFARETKITFLVHGFNVGRQDGTESLLRLANLLPSIPNGAICAVLWPGDSWVGPVSYPLEGNDADDSAVELTRFIDRVVRPGTHLSFVSHSLGARVVMETINRLIGDRYAIDQICLMAAAIDDYSVAAPDKYSAAVAKAKRVAVLASRRDLVLTLAYPLGDVLQAFIFFWRDEVGLALGYHGPKPFGKSPIPQMIYPIQISDDRNCGHSDYVPGVDPSVNQLSAVEFANKVLQGLERPQYV